MALRRDALRSVYRMDFADRHAYVGVTSRPVEDRIQEHLELLLMVTPPTVAC